MFTLPNLLTLLRLPLAFLFLQQNPVCRSIAILLAMISDGLDGFLARRYQQSSRLGTLLDPLMDRFFVFFAITVLVQEEKLHLFEMTALLSRDIAVLLFGCYLLLTGKISTYRFHAIWCGKVTTFLQFLVFLALTFNFLVPPFFYFVFFLLGCLALVELYLVAPEKARLL